MNNGTSGFMLTERENGSITIEYVDYGVSEFGGCDYEKTYILNCENAEKFRSALQSTYNGSLEEMIEAAFGRKFSDRKFWDFCKENSITYSESSWTSGGDYYR